MTDDHKPFERKARAIICTKNNYTEDDVAALSIWAQEKCKYLVYGKEIGESGTPHLQVYFELRFQMSYTALNKKLFNAYFHRRHGTPKQASGYCKKGDLKPIEGEDYSFFYEFPAKSWKGEEFGEISVQGKRTDIDGPVNIIVNDERPMREVALEYPTLFVKYHKGFIALRSTIMPPRKLDTAPEVIVLHGATGTGKTRDAYIKYWPEEAHYLWKPTNGNWWDGYDGEDKIILDEFRGQMPWGDLLSLLDRNECRVPVKGGFVQIQASKFIITSPTPIWNWYKDDDRYDRFAQLERRITSTVQY